MADQIEVSFNSPQCGWMSVGFTSGAREFHTTTAQTPHSGALADILRGLKSLVDTDLPRDEFVIDWSRNPEALKLSFRRENDQITFTVTEYATVERNEADSELVFTHSGEVRQFCEAFFETFQQLYDDRDTDEFEFNWRQPFPFKEFEEFKAALIR